jgi:hypothetical protein
VGRIDREMDPFMSTVIRPTLCGVEKKEGKMNKKTKLKKHAK